MFALDDITVLSLENGISAPLCTRMLGDFGAEVIKVERPDVGDVNRHWIRSCTAIRPPTPESIGTN